MFYHVLHERGLGHLAEFVSFLQRKLTLLCGWLKVSHHLFAWLDRFSHTPTTQATWWDMLISLGLELP